MYPVLYRNNCDNTRKTSDTKRHHNYIESFFLLSALVVDDILKFASCFYNSTLTFKFMASDAHY